MNKLTIEEFQKAMERGAIKQAADLSSQLPRLMENERIVDPLSPSGKKFQAYMEGLTGQLLKDEEWRPKAPVYFLLSESEDVNAYVFARHKPHVMVFTKGLLKYCKNKDELAYILGHELGHIKITDKFGVDRVTKGEEGLADIYQIPWLDHAGMNPLAGANIMTRFWRADKRREDKDSKIDDLVIALLDEHASSALRPNVIQNAVQLYARDNGVTAGFVEHGYQPKEKQVAEIMRGAKSVPYFPKLAKAANYERMGPQKQLEFLLQHVDEVAEGFNPKTRAADFKALLEACDCDGRNPAHQAVGGRILSKLMALPTAFDNCYGTLVMNTLNVPEKKPAGELLPLAQAMDSIVNAKSKEELQAASHAMIREYKAHEKLNLKKLAWPAFKLPSAETIMHPDNYHGVPIPWNRQLAWANQLAKEGDPEAQKALFMLGAEDKRLFDALDYEKAMEINKAYVGLGGNELMSGINPLIISPPPGENAVANLRYDFEKGLITDVLEGDGHLHRADNYREAHKWRPREYFYDSFKTLDISDYAQRIITKSLSKKFIERPADAIVAGFSDWVASNYNSLLIPPMPTPPLDLTKHIQLEGRKALNEQQRILTALSPGHKAFVAGLTEAMQHSPDIMREKIRDFYLSSGKYSLHHLLSEYPDEFVTNCDANHPERNSKAELTAHLSVEFPEIKFLMDDPFKLFTLEEKAKALLDFSYIPENPVWVKDFFKKNQNDGKESDIENLSALNHVFKVHDTGSSNTAFLFETISSAAESYIRKIMEGKAVGDNMLALHQAAPDLFKSIYEQAQNAEERKKRTEQTVVNPKLEDRVSKYLDGERKFDAERQKKTPAIVYNIWEEFPKFISQPGQWPENAPAMAACYRAAGYTKHLDNAETYRAMSDKMIALLKNEASTQGKIEAAEILLFNGAASNPQLKQQAVESWVEGQKNHLREKGLGIDGKDDGGDLYFQAMEALAKHVKAHAPGMLGLEMISLLADKLETQRDSSLMLEKKFSGSARDFDESDGQLRLLEALMVVFSDRTSARIGLLDYLSRPYDDESRQQFADLLRENITTSLFSMAEHRVRGSLKPGESQFDIECLKDTTDAYLKVKAEQVYEAYWQLPMAGRVGMIDQLSLPASKRFHHDYSMSAEEETASLKGDYAGQQQKAVARGYEQKSFDFALKKALPEGMRYGAEAKEFLTLYSEVIPPIQKNLLLSVMLSVERASAGKDEATFGIGKRLAMILDMMGPAERKLGQGINSHPSVPSDLRYDARELKFKASPLTRWDAWHEIDRTVHPDYVGNVKHLGKPLGSASFYVTYEIKRKDGSKGALRMLRNNALPQAKEGFRLLRKFVDHYRAKHPESTEMCNVMNDLVEQARNMAYMETNSTVGLAQMQHAQDLYNGFKIEVDGHSFSMHNANWRAYGPQFMDQEFQPGTHFIELPGDDAAKFPDDAAKQKQFAYKKAAAKAYVTMEFINILSGRSFDHDRHGAQLRIERVSDTESRIGLFDNGAIHAEVRHKNGKLAEPYIEGREEKDDYAKVLAEGGKVSIPDPTKEEKTLLAETLLKAVNDYLDPLKRKPIADTLYDEVKRIRAEDKSGKTPDYLLRVQRALLSLNDFFGFEQQAEGAAKGDNKARFIDDNDLADILLGILNARDDKGRKLIDPEMETAVIGGAMQRMGAMFSGGAAALDNFKSIAPVGIDRSQKESYEQPMFFPAPPPKTRPAYGKQPAGKTPPAATDWSNQVMAGTASLRVLH